MSLHRLCWHNFENNKPIYLKVYRFIIYEGDYGCLVFLRIHNKPQHFVLANIS